MLGLFTCGPVRGCGLASVKMVERAARPETSQFSIFTVDKIDMLNSCRQARTYERHASMKKPAQANRVSRRSRQPPCGPPRDRRWEGEKT